MKLKILVVLLMLLILIALGVNIVALHKAAKTHSPSWDEALFPFPVLLKLKNVDKFNKAAMELSKRMDSSTGTKVGLGMGVPLVVGRILTIIWLVY